MHSKHQDRVSPDQLQNNAIFDRPDIIECSCHIGAVKFPDTNEYQVDFERNKYNDLYNEVRRFYKDFIHGEGAPYIIIIKILKNYTHLLFSILELIKIWFLLNLYKQNLDSDVVMML